MSAVIENIRQWRKDAIQFLFPETFVWRLKGENSIYLTFDDGPNSEITPGVLDILEKYNIKVVFFVVGKRASKNIELLKTIHKQKHKIASHTYNHISLTAMNKEQFFDDVRIMDDMLSSVTGERMRLLRPPYGDINMRNILWAKEAGIKLIHFTHFIDEYTKEFSFKKYMRNFEDIEFKAGDIFLLHDDRRFLLEGLEHFIKNITGRGYKFSLIE